MSLNVGQSGCIVSARSDKPSVSGWTMSVVREDKGGAESPLSLRFASDRGVDVRGVLSLNSPSKNAWHHLVVVRDASRTIRLYVDGVLSGSSVVGEEFGRMNSPPWVNLGGNRLYGERWEAGLAHVAVYPYALGAQQIQKHHELGRGKLTREK